MLQQIFRTFCTNSKRRALLAGTVGVLATIEHLMSSRPAKGRRYPEKVHRKMHRAARSRTDYFHIRQTRSELGYVYWVAQGFGRYRCFLLLDTWEEAIQEALRRMRPPSMRREQSFPLAV
jgi:hypothetical protein